MANTEGKDKKDKYFVRVKGELYEKIVQKAQDEDRTITVVVNRLLENALQQNA